ncbi:hypothetical protein BsWGS_04326 [Bradybaena similaris]
MPSAVRQSFPIDLWQCRSHRKHFNGNSYLDFHAQKIRASPCDSSQKDKKQKCQGNETYVYKPQRNHSKIQRKPMTILRRGCLNTLTTGVSHSEEISGGRSRTSELSGFAKSDSYINVSPDLCNDSYAVDSFVAPDPSQLPLPPLEWMQFSSKQTVFPVVNHINLQSFLCCHTAV